MKNELTLRKQKLVERVNLQIEEVADLFSEETFESMYMVQIIGGDGYSVAQCGCSVAYILLSPYIVSNTILPVI